jgi:hypothetical protein
LGPADLPEARTTRLLQPGVTLTTIVRGEPDPADSWTVEVAIPGGSGSPDPDAPPTALSDREHADSLAAGLGERGFAPRVEEVTTPAVADYWGGFLGYRVRVGQFAARAVADAELARVGAAGFIASIVFTGWDGAASDRPTDQPLHDVTCTDPDELVAFTPQYGASTPTGPGLETVLDRSGRVVERRSPRGGLLPDHGWSIQATGSDVAALRAFASRGQQLQLVKTLVDGAGHRLQPSPTTAVVNGGPELVRDGVQHATPATDGMVHPGDPSFYYGWAAKRNPRTIAGVDPLGRTTLATVDGRSTLSLGRWSRCPRSTGAVWMRPGPSIGRSTRYRATRGLPA